MLKTKFIILSFFLISTLTSFEKSQESTQEILSVHLNAPKGWKYADSKTLPANVKFMIVGKEESAFPPSINLASEPFDGSLKEYLMVVKEMNSTEGSEWKDLGQIKLEEGNASLSQVDVNTDWGMIRMMHVILQKDGMIYIITAASKREDFPKHYKEFFESFRSFKINTEDDKVAATR